MSEENESLSLDDYSLRGGVSLAQSLKNFGELSNQTPQNNEFLKMLENSDEKIKSYPDKNNNFEWSQKLVEDCSKINMRSETQTNQFDEYGQPKSQSIVIYNNDGHNIKDKNGDTALTWAAKNDKELAERLLNDPRVDPNAKNDWGETPAMLAAQYNPELAEKMAWDLRVEIGSRDVNRNMATDYAKQFQPDNTELAYNLSHKGRKHIRQQKSEKQRSANIADSNIDAVREKTQQAKVNQKAPDISELNHPDISIGIGGKRNINETVRRAKEGQNPEKGKNEKLGSP